VGPARITGGVLPYVAVCCCALPCVTLCGTVFVSVWQCVAVCGTVLQCVAVCCSMLPCVALCGTVFVSVLQSF